MHKIETISKDQITEKIKSNFALLNQLGVIKIGLFGSIVRHEETVESDIDLLIKFDKSKKTFSNYLKCIYFLEELLKRKVDLVTIESLSPFIGPHILQEVEWIEV